VSVSLSHVLIEPTAFAMQPTHTSGLTLRLSGGDVSIGGTAIGVTNPTLTLADNATNFVEVSAAGVVSANTTSFTAGAAYLYRVVTSGGKITSVQDWRSSPAVDPAHTTSVVRIRSPRAKVGTTAGWVVAAADNLGKMATLPQSQTSATLVIPLDDFKVGDVITGFSLAGSIQSVGGTATITADLRSLTDAAAGATDASVGAMAAPLSVVANTIVSAANAAKTGLTETVTAGKRYYILVTATTAASTTEELQAVNVTVTEV